MKRIGTNGYRGPLTGNAYLPPGEYTVGDTLDIGAGLVSAELAAYMVGIDLAWVLPPTTEPDDQGGTEPIDPDLEPEIEGEEIKVDITPEEALSAMTLAHLQDLAREREIAYSGLKKADLIAGLLADTSEDQDAE